MQSDLNYWGLCFSRKPFHLQWNLLEYYCLKRKILNNRSFQRWPMEAPIHSNYSNHQSKQGKRNLIIYAVKHVSDEIRSNSKKKNTPKMEPWCENCERDGGNLTWKGILLVCSVKICFKWEQENELDREMAMRERERGVERKYLVNEEWQWRWRWWWWIPKYLIKRDEIIPIFTEKPSMYWKLHIRHYFDNLTFKFFFKKVIFHVFKRLRSFFRICIFSILFNQIKHLNGKKN